MNDGCLNTAWLINLSSKIRRTNSRFEEIAHVQRKQVIQKVCGNEEQMQKLRYFQVIKIYHNFIFRMHAKASSKRRANLINSQTS
jgi:hypothetical protein